MKLRVLIACEFSGVFREAFRELGHNAWSCDIDPATPPSKYHYQCDVRDVLGYDWDLLIAHPQGTEFFNLFLHQYHIPHIAVENPVMSRKHTGIRKPDFNYKNRTCWWTKNLPRLQPTSEGMAKAAAEQWSDYIINYRKQIIGS